MAVCFLAACTEKPPITTGSDIEGLQKLINLPAKPIRVQWRHAPLGAGGGLGPTDYQLDAQMWFTPDALKELHLRDVQGGYDPAPFLKSPFLHGTLHAQDGLLTLHLFTM